MDNNLINRNMFNRISLRIIFLPYAMIYSQINTFRHFEF